jgi:hypothetical protein
LAQALSDAMGMQGGGGGGKGRSASKRPRGDGPPRAPSLPRPWRDMALEERRGYLAAVRDHYR